MRKNKTIAYFIAVFALLLSLVSVEAQDLNKAHLRAKQIAEANNLRTAQLRQAQQQRQNSRPATRPNKEAGKTTYTKFIEYIGSKDGRRVYNFYYGYYNFATGTFKVDDTTKNYSPFSEGDKRFFKYMSSTRIKGYPVGMVAVIKLDLHGTSIDFTKDIQRGSTWYTTRPVTKLIK